MVNNKQLKSKQKELDKKKWFVSVVKINVVPMHSV